MAGTKTTALDDLLAHTTDTGYVVLEGMAQILLEIAYVEATTPTPDPKKLPKAEDYWFWKRQQMIERIR
jgi:hypothetical protein